LPKNINRRLSTLSCSKEKFNATILLHQEALANSIIKIEIETYFSIIPRLSAQ